MDIDSQGLFGVGKGEYNPYFLMSGLVMTQVVQYLIYMMMSCQSFK